MYTNSTIINYYAEIMANHRNIVDDEDFQSVLAEAGCRLVVADFTATWCGPCQKMQPFFVQLAHKYPQALFIGVDVDICRETAMEQGVSAMPTFIFYKNGVHIDTARGANPENLEDKLRQHYGPGESSGLERSSVPACNTAKDLHHYIDKKRCECINDALDTTFFNFLNGHSVLRSEVDEQLLLSYVFTQNVKITSFSVKCTEANGPKFVKFFVDQPKLLDLSEAASFTPAYEVTLQEKDLTGLHPIEVTNLPRFQTIRHLQVFVGANQAGSDTTQIDSLTFFGSTTPADSYSHEI